MKKILYNYYDFFTSMIDYGCKSADMLLELLQHYDYSKLVEYKKLMHEVEHEADQVKHEMMKHLLAEFLPPIDREDISDIAQLLDDVCDSIEEVMLCLYVNDIHVCRPDVTDFAAVIVKMCSMLKNFVSEFQDFKKDEGLTKYIIDISSMEEEGDRQHLLAVRRLMTDGSELRDVIIWREIYNYLENCCDACEHVVDALEQVILKNT